MMGCTQLQRLNQAQDQAEEIVYDTAEDMLCKKIDVDDAIARYGKSPVLFLQWAEFCRLYELIDLVQSLEKQKTID